MRPQRELEVARIAAEFSSDHIAGIDMVLGFVWYAKCGKDHILNMNTECGTKIGL
jgi:hypothetical protein